MDAIITVNEEQRIILFNPAAEQMFGVDQAVAMGQPISRFIPARYREAHDGHIRRFRETGATGRRMGALGAISGLREDGTEFPIEASISQVDLQGERLSTVILRDITERIANEEARLLLAREVDHRAKNALAVVQALVSLTTAPSKEEFIAALRGRVSALGRAHSLLAQNRWTGAELAKIIEDETAPYCKPGQTRVRSFSVSLLPHAVQPVSLLIHELATNAVKYGAFSVPSGRVDVSWFIDEDDALVVSWIETGLSAAPKKPESSGFGSTLIDTVTRQLGGEVSTQWERDGVHVVARLPAASYRRNASAKDTAEAKESANLPEKKKRGRLLIAEDELLVAMELCQALEANGWETIGPAATVEDAFRILANEPRPDAAILDINLNGEVVYPVADLLNAKGIPYLFCTGYEAAGGGPAHQNAPILKKPTNLDSLLAEVQMLIDYPPPPNGIQAA